MANGFKFPFAASKVPRGVVAKFGQIGVTDEDVFAKMAGTDEGIRSFLRADITLVPDDTARKVLTARLVGA